MGFVLYVLYFGTLFTQRFQYIRGLSRKYYKRNSSCGNLVLCSEGISLSTSPLPDKDTLLFSNYFSVMIWHFPNENTWRLNFVRCINLEFFLFHMMIIVYGKVLGNEFMWLLLYSAWGWCFNTERCSPVIIILLIIMSCACYIETNLSVTYAVNQKG
jgi:hypothetical protein